LTQLSSQIRVTPWSCTVPVLKVQNSRIVLPSPISSAVGSPAYFLSCGGPPTEANWNTRLARPHVVRPSIVQFGCRVAQRARVDRRHGGLPDLAHRAHQLGLGGHLAVDLGAGLVLVDH